MEAKLCMGMGLNVFGVFSSDRSVILRYHALVKSHLLITVFCYWKVLCVSGRRACIEPYTPPSVPRTAKHTLWSLRFTIIFIFLIVEVTPPPHKGGLHIGMCLPVLIN